MEEYKVHIESDLDERLSIMLNEYWKIKNRKFVNKPTRLCKEYNIKTGEFQKIVKEYSYCIIVLGYCSKCGVKIEKRVFSQSTFKGRHFFNKICQACESDFRMERRARQIEENAKSINRCFKYAVDMERWKELEDEELVMLKKMVHLKDKSMIYKTVFNGNPHDKLVWKKVDKIEKKGLLFIERKGFSVNRFLFPQELEEILLTAKVLNKELDSLNLSMSVNNNRSKARQPAYTKIIVLKKAVRLDAGIKYICGGWINEDGSINIRIQPLDKFQKQFEPININNEPVHIRKYIEQFMEGHFNDKIED